MRANIQIWIAEYRTKPYRKQVPEMRDWIRPVLDSIYEDLRDADQYSLTSVKKEELLEGAL